MRVFRTARPWLLLILVASLAALFVVPNQIVGDGFRLLRTSSNSEPQTELMDCTAKYFRFWAWVQRESGRRVLFRPLLLEEEARVEIFRVASRWAEENCYLPCSYSMCGALVSLPDGSSIVEIMPHDDVRIPAHPDHPIRPNVIA